MLITSSVTLRRREQYGFSYIQVPDAQMEAFAPVVRAGRQLTKQGRAEGVPLTPCLLAPRELDDLGRGKKDLYCGGRPRDSLMTSWVQEPG